MATSNGDDTDHFALDHSSAATQMKVKPWLSRTRTLIRLK
jgi:hypothetical protein